MKNLTALELFEAIYDSAASEFLPSKRSELLEYIDEYAFNVYGISIDKKTAELIADTKDKLDKELNECNGAVQHTYLSVTSTLEDVIIS